MTKNPTITGELRIEKKEPISEREIEYLSQDGWKLKEISEDRRVAVFELLTRSRS